MDKEAIVLQRSTKKEHISKNGLLKQDGKLIHNDGYMHSDLEGCEDSMINEINRMYCTRKDQPEVSNKSISLEINLNKGINRAKLVQKRVPVRGKNGKVFYRMQWVDPNTGMPVSEQPSKPEELPKGKTRKVVGDLVQQPKKEEKPPEEKPLVFEATKKKEYDLNTRKGAVERFIDDLSRKDKEKMLEKYDIQWDKHDHPMKNWMNAVMALKEYAYQHPEIAGADHLPRDVTNTGKPAPKRAPNGTDAIQDWINNTPREELYKICKQAGIADIDPAKVPEYSHNHALRHFNNMGKLKAYLKDNPHLIDRAMKSTLSKPSITSQVPGSKPTSSNKSAAQKGGNTIEGILGNMSREKKYEMMKRLGISDGDPLLNPKYGPRDKGGNGMAAMIHMHNMMKLKGAIEKDPSILNYSDAEKVELSEDEKERLSGMDDKQKLTEKIKTFIGRMSKEMKQDLIDDEYADEPTLSKRKRYDDPNKDWMESVMALRRLFESNPGLMENHEADVEKEELINKKITNKQMEKFLRRVVGVKGEFAEVRQTEKYKEWSFGLSSFARIEEDDSGDPILSVVNTGEDGDDWEESTYKLKDVHEFMEEMKADKNGDKARIDAVDIPLHEKNIVEIEKALQQNLDKNYTPEVGEVMKKFIRDIWESVGKVGSISDICKYTNKMGVGTVTQLLKKWGVPISPNGKAFNVSSDEWKQVAYGHLVTSTKTKHADDYLVKDFAGENDTWILHQSAKQWSPEERAEARKDLISTRMVINEGDGLDQSHIKEKMTSHYHQSTEFVPFDLFSDMLAGGLQIHFDKTIDENGRKVTYNGNHYNPSDNIIHFNHRYITDESMDTSHPFDHKPKKLEDGYIHHRFSSNAAHETAHALDSFFSKGSENNYLDWNTKNGRKYIPERYLNCVHDSYDQAVSKSNPNKNIAKYESEVQPYFYHKDEWISSYEARIYGNSKDPSGVVHMPKNADGSMYDPYMESSHSRGLEHWSSNVERYSQALHAYKRFKEENPDSDATMNQWSFSSYKNTMNSGYGGDYESEKEGLDSRMYKAREEMPLDSVGYEYHAFGKYHKHLSNAIHHIFNRGDFIEDRASYKPVEAYESGDYTRKSGTDLIVEL